MNWLFCCLVLLGLASTVQAQDNGAIPISSDSLYREDQFYLGVTYNIVTGEPSTISTSQFSGGFHTGFIRDFPLNAQRNIAIGVGLGWSIDTYGHNLYVGEAESGEGTRFEVLDRTVDDFDSNRFSTQSIDLPLQFRWRTSTSESHRFWRVYGGLRGSYLYYFQSKFVQQGNDFRNSDVSELQRIRMGATLTFGYNTFNFYVYYSLNSFFKEGVLVEDQALDLKSIQVGLVFFLL